MTFIENQERRKQFIQIASKCQLLEALEFDVSLPALVGYYHLEFQEMVLDISMKRQFQLSFWNKVMQIFGKCISIQRIEIQSGFQRKVFILDREKVFSMNANHQFFTNDLVTNEQMMRREEMMRREKIMREERMRREEKKKGLASSKLNVVFKR